MKLEAWLAFRYVFRNRSRHISFISLVSLAAVSLGVAALVIVIAVMSGFDEDLKSKLLSLNFPLVVTLEKENRSLVKDISKIEGVKNVVLFSQNQVAIRRGKSVYPVMLEAVSFDSYSLPRWQKYLKEGSFQKGLAVGKGIAQRFFLGEGEEIQILSLSGKKLKSYTFRIGGIFSVGMYDFDNTLIVGSFSCLENFLLENHPRYYLGVEVTRSRLYNLEEIKRRIASLDLAGIIAITTWQEQNQALFSALKLEKITMFIILSLIVLVGSFNIFSTLTVKVVEKTKDIGIMKSLGLSPLRVSAVFTLQGIIIAFLGVFMGVVLGVGVCFLLKEYHFIHLPSQIYYIDYLPVLINPGDILTISLASIGLCIFSSLIPSLWTRKISESEALRYE